MFFSAFHANNTNYCFKWICLQVQKTKYEEAERRCEELQQEVAELNVRIDQQDRSIQRLQRDSEMWKRDFLDTHRELENRNLEVADLLIVQADRDRLQAIITGVSGGIRAVQALLG
jgi:chromosome segregation ATPase